MNIIARLEYELAYYDSAVHRFNHYTTRTPQKKQKVSRKTITDADYADDIAILANTPDQAETLLHSLERAAEGIDLYVNAHKTEYMCYNQMGDISILEGTPLKLVDKFTYLGSSVESTEKDIETRLTKAWTAINRLSIIWKSDLTDKMKRSFFQAAVTSILLYGCTTWTFTKQLEKKLDGNCIRMLRAILNKSWRQHPTSCPEGLPRAMNDREEWRERVRDIHATSATWWWWWLDKSTWERHELLSPPQL